MSGKLKFGRTYADFGKDVRGFEKTPEVIAVVEEFMELWGYSLLDLLGAEFSAQWLRAGESPMNSEDTLDLIFEIESQGFFEIVLRDGDGTAFYGGYLSGVQHVRFTETIVNGYRTLVTTAGDGAETLHEYTPGIGYRPVFAEGVMPLSVARRLRA
ncbi:hypothetical protein GCM10007385_32780 [Tateyamaria omphalii]|uniref:hypothetical protein n=1 Tax=Tateyamaria omphalii TaxID=299262 RepID=UPI00167A9C5D|nr:hypothetical protein [Tateyamaria omphalii]GGX60957.1 hypothetical protein GCM10007385_32780 [Tateyamaria omphalii]